MAEGLLGDIRQFDGRLVSSIKEQKDAEALVKCLQRSFVGEDDTLANRYINWLNAQPAPRPRHALCCVLGLQDRVDSQHVPWVIVSDDGKCPFPVDWALMENPNEQLMVFVQVAFGTGRSVKSHAFHTLVMGSEGNK